MKGKTSFVFAIIIVICVLSGCRMIALPGQEPFGEQTYSDDQAQSVYEDICVKLEQVEFSNWGGYSIELDETSVCHAIYRTEEYTAAWHEGAQDYLWYQGRLYCMDGETLAYRDMDWAELQSDEYVAKQWEFACTLLAQEADKLEYQYIPMSSNSPYLLTAEYLETEWEGQDRRFPKLSVRLDKDGGFSGFTLHWQEGSSRVIDLNFFPYENSSDLQAERKIWSFAYDLGLIERNVPALSTQQDDRTWSQSMIASIDFDSILDRAEYQEDLTFPVPPER